MRHLYGSRETLGCWMIGVEDVEVGLFGARVTVVTCLLQGFFKGQWKMPSTPEVNEIRLLASVVSPSDTVPH